MYFVGSEGKGNWMMKKALLLLIAVIVGSAPEGGLAQQTPSAVPLVLKGATIIDGLGSLPVQNGTIVIEGDKISSVGAGVNYPSNAKVIDVTGKFIIPGLVDSHTHWQDWNGEISINYGVTSVIALANIDAQRRADSKDNLSYPRIFHSGGSVPVTVDMTEAQVREAVQNWLKTAPEMANFRDYEILKPVYRWAADEVHKAGFKVFGHTNNVPESVAAGQDSIEHVWGFFEALMTPTQLQEFQDGKYVTWANIPIDWNRMDQMIKDVITKGVSVNPTLTYEWSAFGPSAHRREAAIRDLMNAPGLTYIDKGLFEKTMLQQRSTKQFSDRYEQISLLDKLKPEDLQAFNAGYKNVQEFLKRYVRAGGKIHAGTDSPPATIPGLALHHEMAMLVEAGLTPMEALKSATSWVTEIYFSGKNRVPQDMNIASLTGSIKPGNYADLVVLKGNPLDDITNTEKIDMVLKGGKVVRLGYNPNFVPKQKPPNRYNLATPKPEISAITPSEVSVGSSDVEITIEGEGFVGFSVVKSGDTSLKTEFLGPRRLKATVPKDVIARVAAAPNPFNEPGPQQRDGITGDRIIPISVYNQPPVGGESGVIVLRLKGK